MVDTFIADQVLAQINLFPELHDQNNYQTAEACGTTRCIAGWAVYFSDKYDIQVSNCQCVDDTCDYTDANPIKRSNGLQVSWDDAGADALGIDEWQAQILFHEYDNKKAVHKLKDLLNEQ